MRERRQRAVARSFVVGAGVVLASVAVAFGGEGGRSIHSSENVALTDDDGGVPLFVVPALGPGQSASRCMRVAYSGSDAANVRLSASATGTLSDDLTVRVERGSGGGYGNCAGFAGSETYNGPLAGAQDTWQAPAGDAEATYRLHVTMAPDAPPGSRSAEARFTWEATQAPPTPTPEPPPPAPTATPTPTPTATPTPTPTPTPSPRPRPDRGDPEPPGEPPQATPDPAPASPPVAVPVVPPPAVVGPEGGALPDTASSDPDEPAESDGRRRPRGNSPGGANPGQQRSGDDRDEETAAGAAPGSRGGGDPPAGKRKPFTARAVEAAEQAVSYAAPRAGFPLVLLLLVVLFLLFQNRLDSRDPKLALAPLRAETDLEFENP